MFVRAYEKKNDRYHKSIVYGTMGTGYFFKYILLNPYTDCFELVDYIDEEFGCERPMVETIQADHDGCDCLEKEKVLCYGLYEEKNRQVDYLFGYPDIRENKAFIQELWEKKSVPKDKYPMIIRTLPDEDEWTYIKTQDDADAFMRVFAGFHDAILKKMTYQEDSCTILNVIFDNEDWFGTVELCFEGVLAVNLRPPTENMMSDIFGASLLVENETIFWADEYIEKEDFHYEGNFIKALNLKWKKLEDQ